MTVCSYCYGIRSTFVVISSLRTKNYLHFHMPKTKKQFKQWDANAESEPKKVKTSLQQGKLCRLIFGIAKESFSSTIWKRIKLSKMLISHLYETISKPSFKKSFCLQQSTSSLLCSCRKIDGIRIPNHSASSLSTNLRPFVYYLFYNKNKWVAKRRFYSNEDMVIETNAHFKKLGEFYSEEIHKPKQHWTKCIILKRDFVEKQRWCTPKQEDFLLIIGLFKPTSYLVRLSFLQGFIDVLMPK